MLVAPLLGLSIPKIFATNFAYRIPNRKFSFSVNPRGPALSSLIFYGHRYQFRLRYHSPTPHLTKTGYPSLGNHQRYSKSSIQETSSMNSGAEGE